MKRAAAILLAIIMCFTACGKKTEEEVKKSSVEVMENGGTVVVSVRKPDTFNPLTTNYENCRELFSLFYDGLFDLEPNYKTKSRLALSYTATGDGLGGTLALRSGVYWSDGTPFTSNDVVYTVNFIKANGGSYGGCVTNVATVFPIDSMTVGFTFINPDPGFDLKLTFPIVKSGSEAYMAYPVGTGQFILTPENISYTELNCVKNDGYYLGRPYLDGFRVLYMNTDLKAAASFESGETELLTDFKNTEKLSEGDRDILYSAKKNRLVFLGFNCQSELFKEDTARLAVSAAINRAELSKDSVNEIRTMTETPINPDSWLYDSESEEAEARTAQEILSANGWSVNGNGMYEKDGRVLSFRILVSDSDTERVTAANLISKQLIEIGISADVLQLPAEVFNSRLAEGNYDAFLGAASIGSPTDLSFFCGTEGANVFRYSGGVMDLRLSALRCADSANQIAEAKKFMKAYRESCPAACLYFVGTYIAAKKQLRVPSVSPVSVYSTAYTWYLVK